MKGQDIVGMKFGRLTVEGRLPSDSNGNSKWLCRCDCGGTSEPLGQSLRSGATTSCGCIAREKASGRATHGASGTSEYKAWHAMIERCTNPSNHKWKRYGARGIKVCARWLSYENFVADMGPRVQGLSIDRKDNNGDYEPGNCRWATPIQQGNNRENNKRIQVGSEFFTMPELARLSGIGLSTLRNRVKSGWPIDAALSKQPQPRI